MRSGVQNAMRVFVVNHNLVFVDPRVQSHHRILPLPAFQKVAGDVAMGRLPCQGFEFLKRVPAPGGKDRQGSARVHILRLEEQHKHMPHLLELIRNLATLRA
jgi:hypothetical protein